jgi:hypothetical protein
VFNYKKAEALSLLCGVGTDYLIELEKDVKRKEKEVL